LVTGGLFLFAIVVGAYVFAPAALTDLIAHSRVCMDLLVLIAATIAAATGNVEEAAILVFFYALAKNVYLRSLAHAGSSMREFTDALPQTVTVLREGRAIAIPASQLAARDIVIVAPGGRLPTDGRIISGLPTIVPSPVLGPGAPSNARRGDVVLAGSTNLDGELTLRASGAPADSVLFHIIGMLQCALASEGPEQRAGERYYLGPYSLLVLLAALAIAIVPPLSAGDAWASSFMRASAFIVAAASWALVASSRPPTVIAFTAAARLGVFIKAGRILQGLATLRAVVISASALAEAEPDISNIDISTPAMDTRSVIALAADVAHASGRADLRPIASFARSMGIVPRLVHGTRTLGGGAAAWTQAGWVYITRPDAVEVANRLKPRAREAILRLQAQGRSVFVMGSDTEVWGFVATRQKPRADVAAVVRALRSHGVKWIVMLAADDARAVQNIAGEVSIDEICNRSDQTAKVRELVARYGHVAVIASDDADEPALAEASVRIRLGATDVVNVARSADVLQLRDELASVVRTLRLARGRKNIIRQNIALSLLTQAALIFGVTQARWTLALVALANFVALLLVVGNAYRFHRSVGNPSA
jgi:Cd2+/Zn2+-exporting ATPase